MLSTFQLVNGKEIISPCLVTTRTYGTWLEETFGEYIAQQELYMKSVKSDGTSVLEWHPGTRIGKWFDNHLNTANWYIAKDSAILTRLQKYSVADIKDAVSKVKNRDGYYIRLYTVQQIELYIKTCIDKNFDIAKYIGNSKQIKVTDNELLDIVGGTTKKKRTLF